MSYFKDSKYVKTIAESSNFKELTEEACRFALSEIEITLRTVIIDSVKYTRKFNRSKIKSSDVQLALADMNLEFLMTQSYTNEAEKYNFNSSTQKFELVSEDMYIKDRMKEIITDKLLKRKKIAINIDWLAIKGELNKQLEYNKADTHVLKTFNFGFEGKFKEKLVNLGPAVNHNTFVIKELNPNILTKEANDFFETFRQILEQYFDRIDQSIYNIDFKEFYYTLSIIRTNPRVGVIVPFILLYIYKIYDIDVLNGYAKKDLFLDVLYAMFDNPHINLEYHLHIIVDICAKFVVLSELSVNKTDNEMAFRERSANLLSQIVNNFDFKYANLKYQTIELFHLTLKALVEKQQALNLSIINGIFSFFSKLNSNFLLEETVPFLSTYIRGCSNSQHCAISSLNGVILCWLKMIQFMVQNDMGPRSRTEISNEICSTESIVPYVSKIYDNLYNVLEKSRVEEIRISQNSLRDTTFMYLI